MEEHAVLAEPDDPVVSEVNVYVTQALTRHLYVLQYPNRPACYSRDQQELLKARIKPVQNKVELEMSLPMDGSNYSNSKGESIVRRIECGVTCSNYERGVMDRQVLTSKPVDMATSRYAIAVLKDGELHLVPLQRTLQLRPDFSYLDKAVMGDQKLAKEREGVDTEEEEEEARPVQVQIARVKSERAEAARKASYHYQQQLLRDEEWVQLDCIGLEEHRADVERGHLFCSCDDQPMDVQELSHTHFLNSMCPIDDPTAEQVSLKEQVRNILINAVVMTFDQLCMLLSNNKSSDQILQCLAAMATLVQCCWVVKSEVLYKDGTSSDFNGISCDLLRSARDHMLFRFTESRVVTRCEISSVVNLPKEEMLQMMEGVSTWQQGKGWQFKLEYDEQFASQYPSIVKQQSDQWKLLHCKSTASARVLTDNSVVSQASDHTTSNHVAMVTNDDASGNDVANQNIPLIGQDLVVMVKKLVDRSVIKLSALKHSLQLLHYEVDDVHLMEALQEAGITEIDCKWLAAEKEKTRLFTRQLMGDHLDKYRPILLDLLRERFTLTYKEVASKIQERLSEKAPREVILKALKDLCTHKNSKWIINGLK